MFNMNINEYIESGILELYVAGTLSEKESQEVYALTLKHPEVLDEVLKIESEVGNKKKYDPRAWMKAAENTMCERISQACRDLKSQGKSILL